MGYIVGRVKGSGKGKLGSLFSSVGASVVPLCLPLEMALDEGILPQPPSRRMAVVQVHSPGPRWPGVVERALKLGAEVQLHIRVGLQGLLVLSAAGTALKQQPSIAACSVALSQLFPRFSGREDSLYPACLLALQQYWNWYGPVPTSQQLSISPFKETCRPQELGKMWITSFLVLPGLSSGPQHSRWESQKQFAFSVALKALG